MPLSSEARTLLTVLPRRGELLFPGRDEGKQLSIASCGLYPDTRHRWRIALRVSSPADFVLCAMMDKTNHLSERTLDRYARYYFAKVEDMSGRIG